MTNEKTLRHLASHSQTIARKAQKLYRFFLMISSAAILTSIIATRQLHKLEQADYADEDLYS